jgi:hypothetical protein
MTIRAVTLGKTTYHASCVRCGDGIISFENPEYVTDAIQHGDGEIIVDARDIEAIKVACQNCADKCRCGKCGSLLDRDICDHRHIPQTIAEFIEEYPGCDTGNASVYACTVVIDIGNGERIALGETSLHTWNRITEYSYLVCGVVYAGPDRNVAIQRAEEWNRMHYVRPKSG